MKFSGFTDWLRNEKFLNFINRFSFFLSFITLLVALYDLGFKHSHQEKQELHNFYFYTLIVGILAILIRYFIFHIKVSFKVRIFDYVLGFLFFILMLVKIDLIRGTFPFLEVLNKMLYLYLAALVYFVRESAFISFRPKKQYLNPAQLFIFSFFIIIFMGAGLLMLPKATHEGIGFIDALFTATSAVCVTGLIVVDTGSYFTSFGQSIILMLIQIGGLGIMTFASYFSYFFRGQSSYQNQIMVKDATNSEKIGEVFNVLKKIIFITFLIETIGAAIIYFSLDRSEIGRVRDQLFFSVFHSISAFCNAGFSTLESSLYDPHFRFNYPLQVVVALLFILGGIGFPIVLNLYKYIKFHIKNVFGRIRHINQPEYSPWLVNLNTRIVIVTTGILLTAGTIGFYVFEYDNTLAEHHGIGKVVTAFFGGATPRTAGFNSVDMGALNFSTIMLIFFLMWIGASPASTGGGIKTSTIAIATLNFFSLARGKDRIEVYNREVSPISIRRAFAIISLSLMVIGFATFLIATFDQEKTLLSIAFEAFSAYSTVGLSTGITASLSMHSKVVIIFTMFIGRVSMLTIMIALLRKVKHLNYRYPSEEILIN